MIQARTGVHTKCEKMPIKNLVKRIRLNIFRVVPWAPHAVLNTYAYLLTYSMEDRKPKKHLT